MVAGEPYWINDPELVEVRYVTRERVDEFNALGPREVDKKQELQRQIFGSVGNNVHMEKPIRIDYGFNTHFGNNVFINFNLVILDCGKITVGDNVFIAPNVQFYTALHPIDIAERAKHLGTTKPIHIGNDVWIGGGCIIMPGVTIGNGATIGAGSVVTRDIPPDTVAYGNPCKVGRVLKEDARSEIAGGSAS
ncbi:sugar O-acetyltransferase [Pelagicoccus albus]|uniref:Nodulation protein L n=2 Tax=Pelagicoccus albus TaxID=415222 RepID=A0A7X1B719_9BACT|nr:sugar O-acetyltransferase [Pelagicoccus albus]